MRVDLGFQQRRFDLEIFRGEFFFQFDFVKPPNKTFDDKRDSGVNGGDQRQTECEAEKLAQILKNRLVETVKENRDQTARKCGNYTSYNAENDQREYLFAKQKSWKKQKIRQIKRDKIRREIQDHDRKDRKNVERFSGLNRDGSENDG